jgi:hypothetical protein
MITGAGPWMIQAGAGFTDDAGKFGDYPKA